MQKLLLSLALLGATLFASADGTLTYGNWKFNYTGTTADATITALDTQGSSTLDMTANTENVTVTAMRSTVFNGCSNLANLTLPSTMTQFEENPLLFHGKFIGDNNVSKQLPVGNFDADPDITISLTVTEGDVLTNGGSNYWGASIFCIGSEPFPNSGQLDGKIQLYWWGARQPDTKKGKFGIVIAGGKEIATAVTVTAPFNVEMHIADHTVTVTATKDNQVIPFVVNGQQQDNAVLSPYTINAFDTFSYSMATGINANVDIINNFPRRENPQFAYTALKSITGNDYIKVQGNGTLYYADDNSLIYRPLIDVTPYFTIANQNDVYFYANLRTDANGHLDTSSANDRRIFGSQMSTAIAPGSLFKIGHVLDNGGYKIAAVNSGTTSLEFGGKANNHNNLDVCVSQWSQAYVTTWLGGDDYVLTNKAGNSTSQYFSLSVSEGEPVKLTQNADITDEAYHMTIKPATDFNITFGDNIRYQATTLPVSVTIPDRVKTFIFTGVTDKDEAVLQQITGTIPANTPFLAYCEDTAASLPIVDAVAADAATGAVSLFKGWPTRVYGLTAGEFLILDPANHQFVKSEETSVALGVPYILASSIPDYNGASISLPATDPTSIHEIRSDAAAANSVYDLMGRKLAAPAKGINIINGRKIYIK